jgi:mRNA-degrading endonuclease RelE of RelBE toxin-antitoxin system
VRTTVTIDDDLRVLLDRRMRETGKSFKEIVNEALRNGIRNREENKPKRRFKVKSFRLGLPPGATYDKPWVLLEELEGSEYR